MLRASSAVHFRTGRTARPAGDESVAQDLTAEPAELGVTAGIG